MQEIIDQIPANIEKFSMIPIRDVVIFPFTKVAFKIGRPSSVKALEKVMKGDRSIFLAAQHNATIDEPKTDQIFRVGTIGRILQAQRQGNGQIKVVVEGRERGKSTRIEQDGEGIFSAWVCRIESVDESGYRADSFLREVNSLVERFLQTAPDAYTEALHASLRVGNAAQIADSISSHLRISVKEKQQLLETFSVPERLQLLAAILEVEIEKKQLDRNVQHRTKKQMDKNQREYYLNEQVKAIYKELGRKDEKAEIEDLKKQIEKAGMSEEVREKALQEFSRLETMAPMSAESTVSRTYIDWLINMPWRKKSREIENLAQAENILSEDHYGLEKVKERILEYLAVRQLVSKPKGTILCFVGAPGTGKTSLGKSIARATGREFARLALGGVYDEAEIRGHRRTYIGALPGQIIQLMKRVGTINPVILLDEVDKLGRDFRGDPSSALIEVLDPEQNHAFRDHYLDVDYDLSNVFFVATANVLHTIPPALRDRLEILDLSGYTEHEKKEIATMHLIPKQVNGNGMSSDMVEFTDEGILEIIRRYTRETGVRNLEREISSCIRKVARKFVLSNKPEDFKEMIGARRVRELLGTVKFRNHDVSSKSEVGLVMGLAWTEAGGDILQVEATIVEGRGNVRLTGKLGEVMQESAHAALTCLRTRVKELGIDPRDFRRRDLHIHVPEGAIPKDGPSAGIAMATSMASTLTKKPVRFDVAMTGEITLRGKVLPVGGLKEKLLAAHRFGIKNIIISKENEKDLADVPEEVLENLKIHCVETIDEVFKISIIDSDEMNMVGKETPPLYTNETMSNEINLS